MVTTHFRMTFVVMLAFVLILPAMAQDGEGSARILALDQLVAGSTTRVIIEVTAVPSGIPVGGGI